jgi:uncharacterized membrane protein
VPSALADRLDEDDVDRLLGVLASTMPAVAIFSLGALVSALDAASSSATPRTRPLLTQDGTAQNAISTFIGAFLFSVLGLAGLSLGMFGPGGRAFLFGLGLVLVAIVVATLVGSIRRLSNWAALARSSTSWSARPPGRWRRSPDVPSRAGGRGPRRATRSR